MNSGELTIGELAKAAGLTVKAVRHYDRVGLLKPARTDPASGYRLYRADQVAVARLVAELRQAGAPLAQIAKAIAGGEEAVNAALVAHRRRLEARIWKTQTQLHRVDILLKGARPMAPKKPYPVSDASDRELGSWLFNRTWELLSLDQRTTDQDAEMLSTAHASRYHWGRVGQPFNLARGEWQIARVHCVLGNAHEALRHSRHCLAITEANGIADFDLAFAYEGMARSLALADMPEEARRYAALAHQAAGKIADEEDLRIVQGDLATLPVTVAG